MTDWSVLVDVPAGRGKTRAHIDALLERLAEDAASIADSEDHVSIRVAITGVGSAASAIAEALARIGDAAKDVGIVLELHDADHIEATNWERFEAEVEQSTFPDLVGGAEVAAILDVSKQRLQQLSKRADFPSPAVRLAAGPVWLRSSIEAFLRRWDRKPGRPPAHTSGLPPSAFLGYTAPRRASEPAELDLKKDDDGRRWIVVNGEEVFVASPTKADAIKKTIEAIANLPQGAKLHIYTVDGTLQEERTFPPVAAGDRR